MNLRVLIVDDDPELVELYKEILELEGGFVAGVAFDGEEAVRVYKKLDPPPDVVLMDHRMPKKSGLEAAEEILAYDPAARIVFASADDAAVKDALRMGALSFKKKPFSVDELLKAIGGYAKTKTGNSV